MPTLTEGRHPGGFLVWEAFRDYCREVVTIDAGQLEPGTVLGKITVGGKYVAHDPDATDGSETAVAVLWGKADASAGDAPAVAQRRERVVAARPHLPAISLESISNFLLRRDDPLLSARSRRPCVGNSINLEDFQLV